MDIGGSGGVGGIISSPGTEDDKFARRRSRRVSFADTTAVHVFDRDEDFETPPEEREPGSTSPFPSPSPGRSSAGRGDEDDTDVDFHRPPVIFLQDVDSSSPGSAAGSIASADDENFFGPVSASFIQTGRPSDSGMSEDDNHDITMDSRTFSLHFRNIAPPDDCTANSAASLMTPNPAAEGPLKELTPSDPTRTSISGRDALTDMSLLSSNPRTYDYDKISPTLSSIMKKIKEGQQANSPKVGIADVTSDSVLTLSTSEKESREENLCIDNGISSDSVLTSQLSSAATANFLMDAEQLRQQNEVMDTETVLHTPTTVGLHLQVPQGSVSSLSSKRQKLFSTTPLSNSKVASQAGCSLGTEFLGHGFSTTPLKLQELPTTSQLGHQANDMFSNTEDNDSALSVSSHSVPKLKETSESFILGTPRRRGLNEATKVQDTSCHFLTLDSQPSRECNSRLDSDGVGRKRTVKENGHAVQECPEETAKITRSPRESRKELPCVPQPYPMLEEKQNGAHDVGLSENIGNKVVCAISNATEQVLSASISKHNLRQLDMLSDKLDAIHMARKYKRLSTAVRIKDCYGDKQKRLEEARSLHDKLFYEKAKLQINNMKLVKLQTKAELCQDGIQECCFLKSKILGAAQMKDDSLPSATSVNASDKQEEIAIVTEKRLELNNIQQKVEKLRSSLECFRNIKGDIGCDSVVRFAEEQLMMRNQRHIIHRHAGLCKLNDIVKRDNKRDVILNYQDLLFQRIILNISDMSSISVTNSLNGNQIGQAFPNLDASVAFNFVFKAEENHRVSDLRSLQKKTMETSLLLGNLVDVLEEIKLSKLELLNLTSAAFVLESQTCQLGLHLCFTSFKSGKKIAFIIDMTDLNRSVYPSEPSELPIKVCEAKTTLVQTSIDEIMASIRNLQPGCTVILRLCRMVSRLIHDYHADRSM